MSAATTLLARDRREQVRECSVYSTSETDSQPPLSVSLNRLTRPSPELTASTWPETDQLTRQTTSANLPPAPTVLAWAG